MANVTADHLLKVLEQSGYVVMRRPATRSAGGETSTGLNGIIVAASS